LLPPEASDG